MTGRLALVVGLLGMASGSALATPLNLQLQSHPDIASSQIDVTYNAGTLALLANGFSISYEDDGLVATPAHPIFGGLFAINLTVNNAGVATGGTLTISGAIPDLSIPNQTLLSGTISQFGFTTSGVGRLEFVFGGLGGLLASAGPDGHYLTHAPFAGVILNNVVNFPGNFNSSWNNLVNGVPGTGTAVSDTAPTPAPGAAALLALGAGFACRRRRTA